MSDGWLSRRPIFTSHLGLESRRQSRCLHVGAALRNALLVRSSRARVPPAMTRLPLLTPAPPPRNGGQIDGGSRAACNPNLRLFKFLGLGNRHETKFTVQPTVTSYCRNPTGQCSSALVSMGGCHKRKGVAEQPSAHTLPCPSSRVNSRISHSHDPVQDLAQDNVRADMLCTTP